MIRRIEWKLTRRGMLPIINIVGGCNETDEETESLLIQSAVKYVDKAGDFNGIPHAISPYFSNSANMEVSFSIMFPTENDILEFIKSLKR